MKNKEIRDLRKQLQDFHDRESRMKELAKAEAKVVNDGNKKEKLKAAMKKMVQSSSKVAKIVVDKSMNGSPEKPKGRAVKPKAAEKKTKERKINWEIEADLTLKHLHYDPPFSASLNDDEESDDELMSFHNIRKRKGCMAEMLCEYKHGALWWNKIRECYAEKEWLVETFLDDKGIDRSLVGWKFPTKQGKLKDDKKYDDEEIVLQACDMDHQNWLNFGEEGDAGYCKEPYHFFGVKCNMCGREFTHAKVTDGKYWFYRCFSLIDCIIIFYLTC